MTEKNIKNKRVIRTNIVLDGADRYVKDAELVNLSLKKIEATLMSINEQLGKMKNHLAQLSRDRD